jgi:hypothetical protein
MTDLSVSPIKARVIRVVKLDTCGNPVTGASSSQVVAKGFTQVQVSPDYEKGTEFITKLADGTPCVNQKDPAFMKRAGLEAHFCVLSPDLVTLMTGQTEILTGSGSVTGTGNMFDTNLLTGRFSLELWQPVSGVCTPSGLPNYVYWAFPNVTNTQISDFTFELGVFDFVITAETDYTGAQWLDGPGTPTWLPAGTTVPTSMHFLYNVTTTPPPAITAGAVALV